jgi:hypothetical protein
VYGDSTPTATTGSSTPTKTSGGSVAGDYVDYDPPGDAIEEVVQDDP